MFSWCVQSEHARRDLADELEKETNALETKLEVPTDTLPVYRQSAFTYTLCVRVMCYQEMARRIRELQGKLGREQHASEAMREELLSVRRDLSQAKSDNAGMIQVR